MRRENVRPDFRAVLVAFRIQHEKPDIATAKQNVHARYFGGRIVIQNKFHTAIEVDGLRGLEGNNNEFMENGTMNSRYRITEEYDQYFLRRLVQEGSQGDLCLVRERLGLVEYDDLRGGARREKGLKGRADEGVHATPNGFQAALVAGIQEKGAAEDCGRPLLSVEGLREVFDGSRLSGTRWTNHDHMRAGTRIF